MHSKGKITGTGVSTLLCRLEALVCARDCQDPEAFVSVCRAVMAAFLLFRCVIVTVTVVVVVDAMMTSQRMDAWRAGYCQALPGVVMVRLVTQTARVLTAAVVVVVVVVVWRQPSAASSCCCWSTTSRSDRVRCSAPSRSRPPLINLTTTQRECETRE